MVIRKVQLTNFRNHKNLTVGFSHGLNVIVGKNGGGKTSVLMALTFMFNNYPRVNHFITHNENICRIHIDFHHNDEEFFFLKEFGTNSSTELHQGEKLIARGSNNVVNSIKTLMGLKDLNLIYSPQQMDGLLAFKARDYNELFGLEKFSIAQKNLRGLRQLLKRTIDENKTQIGRLKSYLKVNPFNIEGIDLVGELLELEITLGPTVAVYPQNVDILLMAKGALMLMEVSKKLQTIYDNLNVLNNLITNFNSKYCAHCGQTLPIYIPLDPIPLAQLLTFETLEIPIETKDVDGYFLHLQTLSKFERLRELKSQGVGDIPDVILRWVQTSQQNNKIKQDIKTNTEIIQRAENLIREVDQNIAICGTIPQKLNTETTAYLAYEMSNHVPTRIEDDYSMSLSFDGKNFCPLLLLSGGQKIITGILLRYALGRLFNYDFFMFDEPLGQLDPQHQDLALTILAEIGEQVLVVSHSEVGGGHTIYI